MPNLNKVMNMDTESRDPKTIGTAILQPADSKRVADALIDQILNTDFDIASATETAVARSLRDGLTCGLGCAIVSVIKDSVRYAVESCFGSYEMGRIVENAIREGVIASQDV